MPKRSDRRRTLTPAMMPQHGPEHGNGDLASRAVADRVARSEGGERRSGVDRRQYERVLVDWVVDYRATDTFLFAYISDISAMGIFVRTPKPEPPGTRLNLRFSPPGAGGPPLELEGQVTWINPPRNDDDIHRQSGMGIQFVDLTAPQREQILKLVRTFAYLDDEEEARGHS